MAPFRARAGGYVVDMVIFSAIAMIIVVAAGAILLLMTDLAQNDASDAQINVFLAIIGAGTPAIWSALNIWLLTVRGQTGGQYVAGTRLARADGTRLTRRDATLWWFCLNPLLFSWPMGAVSGLPLAVVIALAVGTWSVFVFGVLITLCLVMPLAAIVGVFADPQNRTLHDRVVGTVVVPAGSA